MAIRLENKSPKKMVSYLEDDEILELLEESEDDERWSEEQIDCLSVEELSSSDISDDDEDTFTIFISRNEKENWPATPHTNNIGRTASCNIYHDRPGPPRFAKLQCDLMPDSFRLFFRDKLFEKVRNWTNAEGFLVYKNKWVAINQFEFDKFLGVVIPIDVYKLNNENVAQLWNKEDGRRISIST